MFSLSPSVKILHYKWKMCTFILSTCTTRLIDHVNVEFNLDGIVFGICFAPTFFRKFCAVL